MSTTEHDYEAPAEAAPSRLSKVKGALSTVIGAVVALSLLMALGVWFYRLGVRDAQNVPIIRAATEPTKIRPADPGGAVAPHQDVTSYEIAEGGEAKAGAAVLAPEPVKPNRDDAPMAALQPKPPAPEPKAETPAEPEPEPEKLAALAPADQTQSAAQPAQPEADPDAEATAPADPAPKPAPETEVVEPEDPAEDPEKLAAAGSVLAPAVSPIAPRRPANLVERSRAAATEARNDETVLARRAAASPFQVQLAALPSETDVLTRWNRAQERHKDILRDKTLAIQPVKSGGNTLYRLRVGPFSSRAEAVAVCQALKARDQDCIVAKNG